MKTCNALPADFEPVRYDEFTKEFSNRLRFLNEKFNCVISMFWNCKTDSFGLQLCELSTFSFTFHELGECVNASDMLCKIREVVGCEFDAPCRPRYVSKKNKQ